MTKYLFWLLILTLLLLTACSIKQPITTDPTITGGDREMQINTLTNWNIKGKIAFISAEERQSANIYWRHTSNEQQLKLTGFLGINIFSVNSLGNQHTVEFDGKKYQDHNIDQLLWSLTGQQFPISAIQHWIKGAVYNQNDQIILNMTTKLPESIATTYSNQQWKVNYDRYKNIDGIMLPHKLTFKNEVLTIKLSIKNWQLL